MLDHTDAWLTRPGIRILRDVEASIGPPTKAIQIKPENTHQLDQDNWRRSAAYRLDDKLTRIISGWSKLLSQKEKGSKSFICDHSLVVLTSKTSR